MRRIFNMDIEPRCVYCAHSSELYEHEMACALHGVVDTNSSCKRFRYDPLKRVPPKPAAIRRNYTDEDFTL